MEKVTCKQLSLNDLLLSNDFKLSIPPYQRSYEWETQYVNDLLNDTYAVFIQNSEKGYNLGTIILHKVKEEKEKEEKETFAREIVDGQQRLLTLTILLYCLEHDVNISLLNTNFFDDQSLYYLKNTQRIINSFLIGKRKNEYKTYLIKKILFTTLEILDESELDIAYAFFDSTNSKGKGLTDYNLLKAHHLMFIPYEDFSIAKNFNDFWDSKEDEHSKLFEELLYTLRFLSRGRVLFPSSQEGKHDIYNEFISSVEEVQKDVHEFNNYDQPTSFTNWYKKQSNVYLNMKFPLESGKEILPFKISQTIEGGIHFYFFSEFYFRKFKHLFDRNSFNSKEINYINNLIYAIDNWSIRRAFKAIIFLYYDKFGECNIINFASYLEILLSQKRFEWRNHRISSIRKDKVLKYINELTLVPFIINATYSAHVISFLLKNIKADSFDIYHPENSDKSPTAERYKKGLKDFYFSNKNLIKDESLKVKINFYYQV